MKTTKTKVFKAVTSAEHDSFQADRENFNAEREEFRSEKRAEDIQNFMNENSKKIAPVVAEGVRAFIYTLDDAQLEAYKKIMSITPELKTMKNLNTDKKIQAQAKSDFAINKE